MKDIIIEPPKEKSVFSTSLTKTEASNPILIHKCTTPSSKPKRVIAQSCPNFTTVPPPAPSSKPLVPMRDPPPMLLPPSPPVFSPMQIQAAKSQLAEVQNVLSRSLTNFSSSCPDPSYLRPPFGLGGMNFDKNTEDKTDHTFPQPISVTKNGNDSPEESEARMSELGKSPTIFSLLQGSTVPPSIDSSLRPRASYSNRPSVMNEYEPDIPEDDLLFSISLDQHDTDTSFLADSTRDLYL